MRRGLRCCCFTAVICRVWKRCGTRTPRDGTGCKMRKRMLAALPKPDVDLITAQPEKLDQFSAAAREAHRHGLDGDAWEWRLYVQDCGFAVEDITTEVGLWYGQYDTQVPLAMGEYYAATLPLNRLHVVEDGGNFSTVNNHIEQILAYLTEA